MTTGAIRAAAICSAAEIPSSTGIFTSRTTRSGAVLGGEGDRRLAVAGLADDVVALLLEHLPEVQADERLVLGDHHAGCRPARHIRGLGHARRVSADDMMTSVAAEGWAPPCPDRPTGRADGLKHHSVWVRIPLGAPSDSSLTSGQAVGRRYLTRGGTVGSPRFAFLVARADSRAAAGHPPGAAHPSATPVPAAADGPDPMTCPSRRTPARSGSTRRTSSRCSAPAWTPVPRPPLAGTARSRAS